MKNVDTGNGANAAKPASSSVSTSNAAKPASSGTSTSNVAKAVKAAAKPASSSNAANAVKAATKDMKDMKDNGLKALMKTADKGNGKDALKLKENDYDNYDEYEDDENLEESLKDYVKNNAFLFIE